ncbi:hypothetical protein RHO13_05890 [Orbus wheelerorum]|uniref:hypothetical protein n=1 Tax=Orbus wheelerorum TaxID=3074111 RepID=UPI00370D06C1
MDNNKNPKFTHLNPQISLEDNLKSESSKSIKRVDAQMLGLNFKQCKLCISFLNMTTIFLPISPNIKSLSEGIIFLNDFFDKYFPENNNRNLNILNMREYIDREYIDILSYEWILNSNQACFYVWLYLKINIALSDDYVPNNGLLLDYCLESQTSHIEREKLIKTYFSTYFFDTKSNLKLLEQEGFKIMDKRKVLNKLRITWSSYINTPVFKWLNFDNTEITQIVWRHLQEELPFLIFKDNTLRKSNNIKRRNKQQKPTNHGMLDIEITSFEEMRTASFCSFGLWLHFYEPTVEEVNKLKKKISRTISARNIPELKNTKQINTKNKLQY